MNAKEAREITKVGQTFKLEKDKSYTILELVDQSIEKSKEVSRAEGYLEANKKAEGLVNILRMISQHPHSRFDTAIKEALTKYEEEA